MKKNIFALVTLMSFSILSYAQSELSNMRMAVGVRGGAAIPYGMRYDTKQKVGGEAILDAQYTVYWKCNTTDLGLLTGLSAGFQQIGMELESRGYQYTSFTDGGTIFYSVYAEGIKEKKQSLNIEVPVMLALVSESGVFFNFGPRLAFPVWSRSLLDYSSPTISSYFVDEGVQVKDEVITGKVMETSANAKWNAPVVTLKLGAEIGYEFKMNNSDALGLGLYLDWTAYSYYNSKRASSDMIQITPPSDQAPASIVYNSPSNVYGNKLGAVSLGVKVAYQFNLNK